MSHQNFLLSRFIVIVSLAGSVLAPLAAQAGVNLDINIGPPAPRVIVAPPPRPGYVYAPGYWRWDGGAHVWVEGHWVAEHPGHHWVPDHWVQRGPNWHFVEGHWAPNR